MEISKHIFLGVAQNGTVIPAGVGTFREHAMLEDGTPLDHVIFARPYTIEPKKSTYKGDGTTSLEAWAETMNQRSFNRPGRDAELHFERANRPDRHAF